MIKALRLRQRRRESDEGEGYWPGYVDALVNVVLNLLFLLALLTLAAFVLGQKVGQQQPPAQAKSHQVENANPSNRPRVDASAVIPKAPEPERWRIQLPERDLAHIQSSRNQLVILDARPHEGGMLISLGTPANAWLMSQAQTPEWLNALQTRLGPAPEQAWVWTNTDSDPQRQRQDYLRVVQVREWLQKAGMQINHIHIRLNQGASAQQEVAPVFIWVQSKRGEN